MRLKADLTLLLVSIIWGSAFVAQRVAGQLGTVYLFNGVRYLMAALVVLPLAIRALRSARMSLSKEDRTKHSVPAEQYRWMLLAGFFLFAGSALQQTGMLYTTAGNAGFITSLYVVLVPIVLVLIWRETFHWTAVIAVALAVLGTFLLSTGGSFQIRMGDRFELLGALFWTLHVIALGKYAAKFEPMTFSVGQLLICGLVNLTIGISAERVIRISMPLALSIAYTAFFSLGLCYTLQVWAQKHTPPADAALILSLESVFSVISAWLLLDEKLIPIQVTGCALIFVAVLLSQLKEWNVRGTIDHDHLIEGR